MTTRQHEPSCAYYGLEFKPGSANKICSCPGTEVGDPVVKKIVDKLYTEEPDPMADPTPQWQHDNEEAAAVVEHKKAASKKQAPAKTSVTNPVALCSSAGARSSGWLKVGDGRWRGWVNGPDGTELEIEELPVGHWRSVTDGTVAKSLEQLLKKLLA